MATHPFNPAQLIDICRQNDVSMSGVFGSMGRGEAEHHILDAINTVQEY